MLPNHIAQLTEVAATRHQQPTNFAIVINAMKPPKMLPQN
jgi:hypothetical protein